jgi:hypothetical protein
MWFKIFRRLYSGKPATDATARSRQARRHTTRINLERLEERSLLSDFTASNVSELIAAIDAANLTPEADTITLAPAATFTLTQANNSTHGTTGLPVIASGEDLTILGNGSTLKRFSSASFRLFDVAAGASLTLENLTLQGGKAYGSGVSAQGGAIYSAGDLTLRHVTIQQNVAQGAGGKAAAGGGVYSSGALAMEDSTIQDNHAIGGQGAPGLRGREKGDTYKPPTPGGDGRGGGLFVSGGTALLTDVSFTTNTAQGGRGGSAIGKNPGARGGAGSGGAVYVAGGTATITQLTASANVAQGGAGGTGKPNGAAGAGAGGGITIYSLSNSSALVYLDAFTVAHVTGNTAVINPNISGHYTLV